MKTAFSVLLAAVVALGTGMYVRGIAPPFPWNVRAFDALLMACVAWPLAFGREKRRPVREERGDEMPLSSPFGHARGD